MPMWSSPGVPASTKRKETGTDNIHLFPSSVDTHHFAAARDQLREPADQAAIPRPRLGYYGVIDERLDLDLIRLVASSRPDLSFVFLGPVTKISLDELPRASNIHYLGQKAYTDLPAYLSGWDAALMPFALNEATRFISPTKTPEYLCRRMSSGRNANRRCRPRLRQSTRCVLGRGRRGFVDACDAALVMARSDGAWLAQVDEILAQSSWDTTFRSMSTLVRQAAFQTTGPVAPPVTVGARAVCHSAPKAYDYVIVGAGFAGSVLAERLAVESGKTVLICDRRPHIGGNAYDHYNEAGILVHKYGPHIFHTNSEDIFAYLSQFTAWRPYEHRVLAQVGDLHLPVPINRTTLNALYDLDLTNEAAAARFFSRPCRAMRSGEDSARRRDIAGRLRPLPDIF